MLHSSQEVGGAPRVWQFTLCQCLAAIAIVALVIGAYRLNAMLGWFACLLSVIPVALGIQVGRSFFPGFMLGACWGIMAWIVGGLAEVTSGTGQKPSVLLSILSALIGGVLGAATNVLTNDKPQVGAVSANVRMTASVEASLNESEHTEHAIPQVTRPKRASG